MLNFGVSGKNLIMSPMMPRVSVRTMCLRLRGCQVPEDCEVKRNNNENCWENVPDCAWDLLVKTLDPNPYTRITAENALAHPFLAKS